MEKVASTAGAGAGQLATLFREVEGDCRAEGEPRRAVVKHRSGTRLDDRECVSHWTEPRPVEIQDPGETERTREACSELHAALQPTMQLRSRRR
jgi:hypothetical protein